jgi:hypothetical protein
VFSSSSTAPHLFGDRREELRLPDNILRIWRRPAG